MQVANRVVRPPGQVVHESTNSRYRSPTGSNETWHRGASGVARPPASRMIDVSSIKELCRRWYPRIYFGQPEKGLAHRALADIHESIRELRYYRRTAFVAPPGPSTSDIAAIAAELGTNGADSGVTDSAGQRSSG